MDQDTGDHDAQSESTEDVAKKSAWSQADQGIRGRLSVSDEVNLVGGTKVPTIFIEIENVSDVASPLLILFDPYKSFQCDLVDDRNRKVETAGLPASILTPPPFILTIPWKGMLRFPISVSGYGIPPNAGTLVGLPCGEWLIKKDDRARYFLQGTLKSGGSSTDGGFTGKEWHGLLKLPKITMHP